MDTGVDTVGREGKVNNFILDQTCGMVHLRRSVSFELCVETQFFRETDRRPSRRAADWTTYLSGLVNNPQGLYDFR